MFNIIVTSDPKFSVNKDAIKNAVIGVLNAHKIKGEIEVEVSVVGDKAMHELNKTYRGIDATTDILTFPLEEPNTGSLQYISRLGFIASPDKVTRLGSIVISFTQAASDAISDGKSLDEEFIFLAEHGTKHLLGIHHD